MAGKRRLKLGDIYEINLPSGKKAYGRLFKEYTLAFYNGFYRSFSELPNDAGYYRFICVYKDLEIAAVWDRSHVVDMLMGDTRIDDSIRKPVKK